MPRGLEHSFVERKKKRYNKLIIIKHKKLFGRLAL